MSEELPPSRHVRHLHTPCAHPSLILIQVNTTGAMGLANVVKGNLGAPMSDVSVTFDLL